MTWHATSTEWIQRQARDNPHMNRADLKKHCSKNYPFSQRQGHAYKAFLRAMREQFGTARRNPRQDRLL